MKYQKFILLTLTTLLLTGCGQQTDTKESKQLPLNAPKESNKPDSKETKPMNKKQYSKAPEMQIDTKKTYTAVLKTNKGDITIEFNSMATPKTVNNFIFLAKEGFYDGVIFHRVIDGFMIQGGDPTGTGMGGPGYKFADEPFQGKYTRGTIAMANSGPNTNGSQFFIMHKDVNLPPNYVIFGKVIAGLDVVDAIATSKTTMSASGEKSTPVETLKIEKVEVMEK